MSAFNVMSSLCMNGMDPVLMSGQTGSCQAVQGLPLPVSTTHGASSSPVSPPQMLWHSNTVTQQDPAMSSALGFMPSATMAPAYPLDQLMLQPQQYQMQGQQLQVTTIFFAGVAPIADTQQLLGVFAQFGRVMDLNLFRPYKGCRTSKGCGLVVFSQHSEAAAALETLNRRFVWPGARSPMVIEWSDPNKQHKRKRTQPLAPAHLQQVVICQQQAMPFIPNTTLMPATSISLGHMPNGNASCLMMPCY